MNISPAGSPPYLSSVGTPTEVKVHEYRVGLTPASANEFVNLGLTVYIQKGAGVNSGFPDADYEGVGCVMCETAQEVYSKSDMIIKVKEPQASEYSMIKEHQIVYTYFHFAADKALTEAMIASKATCIAYETVQTADKELPLLTPMSTIAGKMAAMEGAKYLEKHYGGSGVLLGGAPGVPAGKVLILGGGVVGRSAAKVAAGMGAWVTVMDINPNTLKALDKDLPANCQTVFNNRSNLLKELATADIVIGAVLVVGAPTPILVNKDDLSIMKKGSVLIDVAVDQGGCLATCKPTTHDNPTYNIDGIIHYCVGNMPGAVPNTSTIALNNVTISYGLQIAKKGYQQACKDSNPLKLGLNMINGYVTHPAVASAWNLEYTAPEKFLD